MAKQGASYEDIIKTEGEEGEEQEEPKKGVRGSSNTKLPFGLCARYGIPLPENARPRDAWNALKGRGIYPPWTEEGKEQYDGDDSIIDDTDGQVHDTPDFEAGEKISIGERKQMYDDMNTVLANSAHGEQYRKRVSELLENLEDDELQAIHEVQSHFKYTHNKNSYIASNYFGDMLINVVGNKPNAEDKENGYKFAANAFTHEHGHAIDNIICQKIFGKKLTYSGAAFFSVDDEKCKQAYQSDIDALSKRYGVKLGVDMSKEDVAKVYRQAMADSGFNEKQIEERSVDLNHLREELQILRISARLGGLSTETLNKKIDDYNRLIDEEKTATNERMQFLTDFLGAATKGTVCLQAHGALGHSADYYSEKGMGGETFAEYCSMKMVKDSTKEKMFKSFLPATYKRYEEIYRNLPKLLQGERV